MSWNPYATIPEVEPLLLRAWFDSAHPPIAAESVDAAPRLRKQLAATGVARAAAPVDSAVLLRDLIGAMCTTPIDHGFLQLWPVLSSVTRADTNLVAEFELRELAI